MSGTKGAATKLRVKQALVLLEQQCKDDHLSLKSLADGVGLSPCYLSRILILHTGQHFREHLRAVRIARASDLLRDPRLSVKEVAWKVGYAQVSTFYRDFRARYGRTPVQFRFDALKELRVEAEADGRGASSAASVS